MTERNFEHLETRRLFASAPTPTDWVINGTPNNDTILIKQVGNTVTITNNGVVTSRPAVGYFIQVGPGDWFGVAGIRKIFVNGKEGHDSILGNNTVQVPMELQGGAGSDLISSGAKNDFIWGGLKSPVAQSEEGSDTVVANDGDDTVRGPVLGKVSVNAGKGKDTLIGNQGNDHLDGGDDNDSIVGGTGADYIHGSDGIDTLKGDGGSDTIYGDAGNDWIEGGTYSDSLLGGTGNDTLKGDDDNDTLVGDANDDSLDGGMDDDSLRGGSGADTLEGWFGNDTLNGEGNDDIITDIFGDEFIIGGSGQDSISYLDRLSPVSVTLKSGGSYDNGTVPESDWIDTIEIVYGSANNDTLTGSNAAEKFYGHLGDDSISAGGGNDTIYGGSGKDTLKGDAGNDLIYAGQQDDQVHGGLGVDSLHGENGSDTIVSIGGSSDKVYGEVGDDNIWIDNTDTSDVTGAEDGAGRFHVVSGYMNTPLMDPLGQPLPDPALSGFAVGVTPVTNVPLFNVNVLPRDVAQGSLGDCSFLSGVASIADKRPEVIRQSVVELGDGTYATRFVNAGQYVYVRVDNQLPALEDGRLAYADLGAFNTMWAPILEKAAATMRGGYVMLASQVLNLPYHMLNINTFDHWTSDDWDMMNELADFLDQDRVISAATEDGTFVMGDSIVKNHAYAVIHINRNTGMMQLYNPWGSDAGGIANGGWSDGNDDGYVWMSAATFNEAFHYTSVSV